MKKQLLLVAAAFYFISFTACAQKTHLRIGHYNVENLFDTIDDPNKDDNEFLPRAENQWDSKKYLQKLNNLSKVIAAMEMPDILGLVEIENDVVLQDLANQKTLKKAKYKSIWFEGPDNRSIDVGLLYNSKKFKPTHTVAYTIANKADPDFKTRDILVVGGLVNGLRLHILVNHWPSRRGGDSSIPKRMLAASVAKQAIDSIFGTDSMARIVVVGDFNDEPKDASVLYGLDAKPFGSNSQLINLMTQDQFEGKGTHNYRNNWSMLDQIIVSSSLLNASFGLKVDPKTVRIFSEPWMLESNPKYIGQPLRTFVGKKYLGGFSDHLPLIVDLSIVKP